MQLSCNFWTCFGMYDQNTNTWHIIIFPLGQTTVRMESITKLQFYRIETVTGSSCFLINSSTLLSELYIKIRQHGSFGRFTVFYQYLPYSEEEFGGSRLKEIAARQPMPAPVFSICEHAEDELDREAAMYGQGLVQAQQAEEAPREYSQGENGHILFDSRETSLLASSVSHASSMPEYSAAKHEVKKLFSDTIVQERCPLSSTETGLINRLLSKLGIIKSSTGPRKIGKTISTFRAIRTKEDMLKHIDREYSDYDPKFAAYLEAIYLKYAFLNGYRLHYTEYKHISEGVLPYRFPSDAKIAIIGDFGTGLTDSFLLLRDAIIDKQADIVLHLGDVYYAGTPSEYRNHIMEPLNKLRLEARDKFNKSVLFYSIPGNHDYYSWGLPFLTFVASANQIRLLAPQGLIDQDEDGGKYQQRSSYFCLRSEDSRWQFIGLDTAYHDSNPASQINGFSVGPRLRQREVKWFEDKMEGFPGSTILLTHHQLFSIHDRICGTLSQYRPFTCVNPLLSAQLFKHIPSISCWFWGHEHSIMFFDEGVLGTNKCRLLGNSSFHVFEKQAPYLRKKGFPTIPLIEDDEAYVKKYLPINPEPQEKNPDSYFNLSYALIDFAKQKAHEGSEHSSSLSIDYYCCPCFPEQSSNQRHFAPYLLYQEEIAPRATIRPAQQGIASGSSVFLKAEVGLYAAKASQLSLAGTEYELLIGARQESAAEQREPSQLFLRDGDVIALREKRTKVPETVHQDKIYPANKQQQESKPATLTTGHCEGEQIFQQLSLKGILEEKQFIVAKSYILEDKSPVIKLGDAFTMVDVHTQKNLCCHIGVSGASLGLEQAKPNNRPCLFMFTSSPKVRY